MRSARRAGYSSPRSRARRTTARRVETCSVVKMCWVLVRTVLCRGTARRRARARRAPARGRGSQAARPRDRTPPPARNAATHGRLLTLEPPLLQAGKEVGCRRIHIFAADLVGAARRGCSGIREVIETANVTASKRSTPPGIAARWGVEGDGVLDSTHSEASPRGVFGFLGAASVTQMRLAARPCGDRAGRARGGAARRGGDGCWRVD